MFFVLKVVDLSFALHEIKPEFLSIPSVHFGNESSDFLAFVVGIFNAQQESFKTADCLSDFDPLASLFFVVGNLFFDFHYVISLVDLC